MLLLVCAAVNMIIPKTVVVIRTHMRPHTRPKYLELRIIEVSYRPVARIHRGEIL